MADLTDEFYEAKGGFHGYGGQLLVGDGDSPEGFEAIAEITSIKFGASTTAVLRRTHLRSPGAHAEKLAGMRDSDPIAITGNWRPDHASQSRVGGGSGSFANGGLVGLHQSRAVKNFIARLPYGSPELELPFPAFVSKFQPGEISVDGTASFSAELTYTEDASASLP